MKHIAAGEIVVVQCFGGSTAKRRVVADRGKVVVVCNEQEYASAMSQRRQPVGIGFPREAVLGPLEKN